MLMEAPHSLALGFVLFPILSCVHNVCGRVQVCVCVCVCVAMKAAGKGVHVRIQSWACLFLAFRAAILRQITPAAPLEHRDRKQLEAACSGWVGVGLRLD